MKQIGNHIFIIFALLALAACSNDEPSLNDKSIESKAFVTASRSGIDIAQSTGVFGFNLMAALNDGSGNVVVSPFNAAMNLSMLCNGVTGDAKREMLDALGFEGYDQADVNYYFNNVLVNGPKADNNTKMTLRNAVWITNFGEIHSTVKSTLINDYLSDFYVVSNDGFTDSYRQWITKYSNGQLNGDDYSGAQCNEPGSDPITDNTRLSLASALAFESKWLDKFDKNNTTKGAFTNLSETTSMVDFMHQTYQGCAIFGDTYTIAELDLGNRQYKVALILPDIGVDVNTALANVSKIWDLNNYLHCLEGRAITISIPKFKTSKATDLTEAFKTLGVNKIFNQSDAIKGFGQFDSLLGIDQLCALELNEDGAKAQTATKVDLTVPIEPSKHPTKLSIDFNRPFALVIYDSYSLTPVVGAVINEL